MKNLPEITKKIFEFNGIDKNSPEDRDRVDLVIQAVKLGYAEGVNHGVNEFRELKAGKLGILSKRHKIDEIFDSKELLEALSDLEHQQWAEWTDYYFKTQITQEKIDRWTKQMNTSYWLLSEKEKDSDRKFARLSIETARRIILNKLMEIS